MDDNNMTSCKTCSKPTDGYKCDMCGAEAQEHDPNHANPEHGCSGANCVSKCQPCGQAENKCACMPNT